IAKRGITVDIQRFFPTITKVEFVETFLTPKRQETPKKTSTKKKPTKKKQSKKKPAMKKAAKKGGRQKK
ncbi:hypothetical protein KAS06_01270, partial [Candidatus Bathyarchaeota archaeon]|nr:hypothetical protein [Candidatus Bathyarchaeota archaeon]